MAAGKRGSSGRGARTLQANRRGIAANQATQASSKTTVQISTYEAERLRNIQNNARKLQELGLVSRADDGELRNVFSFVRPKRQGKPRKRPRTALSGPARRSRRHRGAPAPDYTDASREAVGEEEDSHSAALRMAETKGYRTKAGKWRGETFGEVPGVAQGTVFGAGDFQRLGRREMSDTGFMRPFVTPEWFEPHQACFAIILNNDNGLSRDRGDRIAYAGSGGRRRGQNRNAAQSFDQSWDNTTNASLKKSFQTKKPVRVIRGPKLNSEHGTAHTGGGYRYDGLYTVTAAQMVRGGGLNLQTAMFTLERLKTLST